MDRAHRVPPGTNVIRIGIRSYVIPFKVSYFFYRLLMKNKTNVLILFLIELNRIVSVYLSTGGCAGSVLATTCSGPQ